MFLENGFLLTDSYKSVGWAVTHPSTDRTSCILTLVTAGATIRYVSIFIQYISFLPNMNIVFFISKKSKSTKKSSNYSIHKKKSKKIRKWYLNTASMSVTGRVYVTDADVHLPNLNKRACQWIRPCTVRHGSSHWRLR